MTEWRHAPEVHAIAEEVIDDHHPHLANAPIRYVFRDTASVSRGRVVLGRARKVSGLNAYLVGLVGRERVDPPADFFVLEIAADEWQRLDIKQRVALVDHELCHLWVEEPADPLEHRKLRIVGHDVEEFTEVIQRHGLWRPSVKAFADAAQMTIDIGSV